MYRVRRRRVLLLDNGRSATSLYEQPVAIASLAKVMTAYLILERYPLSSAQDGFTITVSAAEAQALAQDRAEGQSVVAVAYGEQLTERQLLESLLVPSGNNIAESSRPSWRAARPEHRLQRRRPAARLSEGDALLGLPSDRLDGNRDAAGRGHAHELRPVDR